jgi:hypothetical protein
VVQAASVKKTVVSTTVRGASLVNVPNTVAALPSFELQPDGVHVPTNRAKSDRRRAPASTPPANSTPHHLPDVAQAHHQRDHRPPDT